MEGGGKQPSPQAAIIRVPNAETADDSKLVTALVKIVNAAYSETEGGIFLPGYERTSNPEVAGLIRNGQLAVAYLGGGVEPVGCVFIKLLSPTRGEFGMLALDSAHRGGGLGKQLALFAEQHCRGKGCTIMQLELLFPTTLTHAFKARNHAWYVRMGYEVVRLGSFEHDYPALARLLAGPTEYRVYEKPLL